MQVTMTVNGETVTREIEGRMLLVHFLRDELGLTGTHWGCDTSNCGTCVAWMDGEPVKTCTVLAAMAGGHEVRTVEALEVDGQLDPVQEGFMKCHGLQCGFCTPGMLMTTRALLDRDDDPTEDTIREAISGQICRCTGYTTIVRSVQWAARRNASSRQHPPTATPSRGERVMTTTDAREDLEKVDNDQTPVGHGRMLRKEDPRFIRGMGRYVDDIKLPGMLHLAILRSPVAHARIVSIDISAAQAHPKVKAVITGADLAAQNLAWMPTLSNDVQAVLATDKVRFQHQEVAFVVAEDRYAARDALELIDVEYELLPPVIDVRKALAPDAALIRDDLEGKTDNHCFDWETGDEAATEAAFAKADVVVQEDIVYPRVHPAPMETCGCVADYERVEGKLTLWTTSQAPHAHRTVYALVSGLPEHKIRVIAPDIGGGFGNKVPIYPGYVCAIVASLVIGKPVKWVEDRIGEPGQHRLRPRLRDARRDRGDQGRQDPRDPDQRAGRPRRLQRHGRTGEVPGGLLRRLHGQLRPRGGVLQDDGRLHQQGAGRGRVRLLVPDHRGGLPRRADRGLPGLRARHGPGRAAQAQLHPARAVPVHLQDRLGLRLRRVREGDGPRARDRGVRRPAARAGREARPRRADGHRRRVLHRGGRRRTRARTWTSSGWAWPTAASCASTPPARRCCGCPA